MIRAIAIGGDNIYTGGSFITIGGLSRYYLAKLDSVTGAADASWDPYPNSYVQTISVNGNVVYAGGNFSAVWWLKRNNIARFINATGAADTIWNPDANGNIQDIALKGHDVYIAGTFTTIAGQNRKGVVKLDDVDGSADITWTPNSNGSVNSLAMKNNKLYVGGSFTQIGGLTRNHIARLDLINGNADPLWSTDINSTVYAMEFNGSELYAGGSFTTAGGLTRNRAVKLDTITGAVNATWNPNANSDVRTLLISGSYIYAGGAFTNIGGLARNRIARMDLTTGSADVSWNPNASTDVRALGLSGNSIIAGGDFISIGGQSRNYLARLNITNGNADTWNPNPNDKIIALEINGCSVYTGGLYTTICGTPQIHIARLELFPLLREHPISQSICEGNNALFVGSASGTEPMNYQWQDSTTIHNWQNITGATNDTLILSDVQLVMNATKYRFIVTNMFGGDTSNVGILTVPDTFIVYTAHSICEGDIYSFNGHDYTVAGTYYDTLQTILGCDSVINTQLAVNMIPLTPTISQNGANLISDATTGNQWYDDNGIINGATAQTYTPSNTGNYYCIVTDIYGCHSDTSNMIYFVITGISNQNNGNNNFEIYPNPANDKINVILPEKSEIEVSTIQGELIFLFFAEENHEIIDISRLSKGMYFVKVTNDKGIGVKKFIKE